MLEVRDARVSMHTGEREREKAKLCLELYSTRYTIWTKRGWAS